MAHGVLSSARIGSLKAAKSSRARFQPLDIKEYGLDAMGSPLAVWDFANLY